MVSVNYLTVLIAGVLHMGVGALWYGPLFGKPWMALMGISKESMAATGADKKMGQRYFVAFVGALITAFGLNYIVQVSGDTTFGAGMECGLLAWLAFVVPVLLTQVLWENKPVKLYILNIGYYLVTFALVGGVLAVWR
jgi:hypothetical protein